MLKLLTRLDKKPSQVRDARKSDFPPDSGSNLRNNRENLDFAKRGLANPSANNNFVKHLKDVAGSMGLINIGSKILHDSNQGATTWLLTGQEALKVFGSTNLETDNKGFMAGLFSFFSGGTKGQTLSILQDFYKKSQEATVVDNLGESWEHFRSALEANHYSLMPVYDNGSTDYRDPVAFAVFERFSVNDTQKRSLFNKLSLNQVKIEDLPNNLIYLDKYLTKNSFDKKLDMQSFEKNVIGAFMNSQESSGSILVVPWRTNQVLGLSSQIVKGINHVGFSKLGSGFEITPRHLIDGQSHSALKADTLFAKFLLNLDPIQLKALSLAGTVNEITAGPVSRINQSMLKPIKAFVNDNFKNIDNNYPVSKSSNSSALNLGALFNWITGFFRKA